MPLADSNKSAADGKNARPDSGDGTDVPAANNEDQADGSAAATGGAAAGASSNAAIAPNLDALLDKLHHMLDSTRLEAQQERVARERVERELEILRRVPRPASSASAYPPSYVSEPACFVPAPNGVSATRNNAQQQNAATTPITATQFAPPQNSNAPWTEASWTCNPNRKLHDLPTFSGIPEEWPVFIAAYTQSTEAYKYTSLENTFRLQKCITGPARETIDMLLVHPENLDEAISSLEFQYGRPEQLVESQLAKVKLMRPFTDEHIEQLVPFAQKVRNLVAYLQHCGCDYELRSPGLLKDLLLKMPLSKRLQWTEASVDVRPRPSVVEFSQWLQNMARSVSLTPLDTTTQPSTSTANPPRQPVPSQPRPVRQGRSTMLHVSENINNDSDNCVFCNKTHNSTDCYIFLNWHVDRRWAEVKRLRLCFACLVKGHDSASCQTKRRCVLDNCRLSHHPLLHTNQEASTTPGVNGNPFANAPRSGNSAIANNAPLNQPTSHVGVIHDGTSQIATSAPSSATSSSAGNHEQPLLFRMVPVRLYGLRKTIDTFAMLDEGAGLSMIDEDLANQLELSGPTSQLNLQWFGDHTQAVSSQNVCLEISGISNQHKRFALRNIKTVPNISLPTQSIRLDDLHSSYRHIKRLPIAEYSNAEAKILIGLDFCHLAAPKRTVQLSRTGPIAVNTNLGWIVYGRHPSGSAASSSRLHHVRPADPLDDLEKIIRDYFTTENFGVNLTAAALESADDTRAMQILESTTTKVGDRYQTGLLWRDDDVRMPDSFKMAMRRLVTVESKMRRDSTYADLYKFNIGVYVQKNYARKLNAVEIRQAHARTWYLPHFGVLNPHKPGKLRIVFDAAAKVDGVSLNSMLLSGPDLNPSLTGILFKFRLGAVGICGDIREMFSQVLIQPGDRCSQRFLWRDGDASRPPDVYEMVSMTFGATCSPTAAQFVKNKSADENAEEFPEAVMPIKCLHYVDDYVASFATSAEAVRVTGAVTEVLKRGGFELRNFVSSHVDVLVQIGAAENETPVNMQPDSELIANRILGMSWQTRADVFVFTPNYAQLDVAILEGHPSKREVLSLAMSVFDPFGLLADFLLHAKLLIQDLWRAGLGWDEPIPNHLAERWRQWCVQLKNIETCRVLRCYSPHIRKADVQIHVFADASESAFAAVAFWRVCYNGEVDVSFICGKTKCAPLKMLSVPRLELQAAVLATRMLRTIRQYHDLKTTKTLMWTDSTCVVQWIRSDHRKYKPFVAHRIAEVLEETAVSDWRWLPTSHNVADDATRASNVPRFDNESRWLRGPAFLQGCEADWPVEANKKGEVDEPLEEIRAKYVGVVARKSAPIDFGRFSNYHRVRRVLAWALRFAHNSSIKRHKNQRRLSELTTTEIHSAEIMLCRWVQAEVYDAEYAALSTCRSIDPGSSLVSLRPFLDDQKIMRLDGRTDAADTKYLSDDAKRPIILPAKHALTRMMIEDQHRRMAHMNDDTVICAVRERFWVPSLRGAVRQVRRDCQMCKVRCAQPRPPVMGQLPRDRLTPFVRPFSYTGLDYFGPVHIAVGRRREKRWVALFTCLTVRAVHLEIAEDLSTDACLVSIRNFCHIRGVPVRIRSDNGTNFIGASKTVRDASGFLDQQRMQRELATTGVQWIFNSPGNPEAGGCWERLVQSVKRVLVNLLHTPAPRVETLRCVLLEAANIVNSRPLTHVPVTPDEEEPLTPNHFLIGCPNSTMTPVVEGETLTDMRKQWRVAQHMAKCFWSQWIRLYLPELTRRTKWHQEQPALGVGDLVLICDTNQSRGQWRRGRVIRTFPGPDGRVRNVEVKTSEGVLRRPTSRLAVLDVVGEHQMFSVHGGRNVAE